MFGDTEIEPSVTPPVDPAYQVPQVPPPVFTPPTPSTPPAPVRIFAPKPKPSILPIIFGFLLVIIASAAIGVVYYKNKLTVTSSPSPKPSITASPSIEPSAEPSSTASASPKASTSGSAKPTATPKPTIKPPVSVIKASPSPTPTPIPLTTLDVRFGNPSANIKQTIDEGAGDGRVINREYTSIQAGQFDEVQSSWSPRVTVCFHMVSNENIEGKNVKFSFSLDDKVEVQDTLSQYDKLEAGRLYDWCHDVTTSIGKHTAKLSLNGDKSLKESNYVNNLARVDWENLTDKIAPNFTLMGPNNEGAAGTCLFPQYISDNVTAYADLKIEQKVDSSDWTKFDGNRYCFIGTAGSSHSYTSRITDARGNASEQSKTFVLY